jgi:hypothetical protein
MPLSALTSTTASSSKKAGFAKPVDASAAMGADLALASSQGKKTKLAAAVVQLGGSVLIFACDGLAFNGLLFVFSIYMGRV